MKKINVRLETACGCSKQFVMTVESALSHIEIGLFDKTKTGLGDNPSSGCLTKRVFVLSECIQSRNLYVYQEDGYEIP